MLITEIKNTHFLGLYETRFIERQAAIDTMLELIPTIIATLHELSERNDIMNHPHGFFKDFEPAQWMTESGMLSSFAFNRTNGIFMVREPGIYFMYAQIFFTARHERSGFYIKKNGDNVAQCMTTSHTSGSDVKRNTCFTAAIIHLHEHDKLSIREVDGSRFRDTSFKDSHSFFGLIQLKST
ncbi:hypothetical protein J6590_044407 [Homalodisca vitripennis]|nr:hypothetical protein J6590_044407 [Homalodisca vitripennis]